MGRNESHPRRLGAIDPRTRHISAKTRQKIGRWLWSLNEANTLPPQSADSLLRWRGVALRMLVEIHPSAHIRRTVTIKFLESRRATCRHRDRHPLLSWP